MSSNDYYEGGGQSDYGSGGRQQGGYGGGGREEGYGGQGGQGYGGTQGGGYGGGGFNNPNDEDLQGAAHHAQQHAGSSGDSNIFSSVLGNLMGNKQNIQQGHLDEQGMPSSTLRFAYANAHRCCSVSPAVLWWWRQFATAMQALKMFSGGQSGNSQSGNSQNAFVGMAMAEASKLFDSQASQGNVASGASKESAIQQAGEMALKMYMKSQGGGGGGASGLLGLASKFM